VEIEITTTGGEFEIAAPYQLKDHCAMLPGRRWDATRKRWIVPANPLTARQISDRFDGHEVKIDEDFVSFLKTPAPKLITGGIKTKKLWAHQRQGAQFILNGFGVGMLAMDMGTGKTLTTIVCLNSLWPDVTIILCPKSVCAVWISQFKEHAPNLFSVQAFDKGSNAKRTKEAESFLALAAARKYPAVIIINYDSAWREPFRSLILNRAKAMVLDESQRIKAAGGKASLFCKLLGEKVSVRIACTGTPMPHSPLDIYAQGRAINPLIFGKSALAFKHKYAVMGGFKQKQIMGWRNTEEMSARINMLAFQVKREDVFDLPGEMIEYRQCELGKTARKVYNEIKKDFFSKVDSGLIVASNALVQLLRLQQITSGIVTREDKTQIRVDDSKRNLLKETLEDIGARKIIVYCRFRADLDAVHEVCNDLKLTSGEVSGRQKDLTDDAKMPKDIDVLAVQMRAGALGIDLTRAPYGIFYSVGFSLGDYEQAKARQCRPGQTQPVLFIHLLAEKTVDSKVFDALKKRKEVVQYVLDYGRE